MIICKKNPKLCDMKTGFSRGEEFIYVDPYSFPHVFRNSQGYGQIISMLYKYIDLSAYLENAGQGNSLKLKHWINMDLCLLICTCIHSSQGYNH